MANEVITNRIKNLLEMKGMIDQNMSKEDSDNIANQYSLEELEQYEKDIDTKDTSDLSEEQKIKFKENIGILKQKREEIDRINKEKISEEINNEQEKQTVHNEEMDKLTKEENAKKEGMISQLIGEFLENDKEGKVKEDDTTKAGEKVSDGTVKEIVANNTEKDENMNNTDTVDENITNKVNESDTENLKQLRDEISKLTSENTKLLEDLKKQKKSSENDDKILNEMKKKIEQVQKEKEALKDKYAGKLPEFGGNLAELPTKKFEFKILARTREGGQTKLRGPEISIRHNVISRHKINVTIRKLNKLGKELGPDPEKNPDPQAVKKGVNYILNRSFLIDGGHLASACRGVANTFRIKTIADFDKEFGIQKKYIIGDLKSKMEEKTMSKQDRDAIDAVSKRLDYYQAAYKRIFIKV